MAPEWRERLSEFTARTAEQAVDWAFSRPQRPSARACSRVSIAMPINSVEKQGIHSRFRGRVAQLRTRSHFPRSHARPLFRLWADIIRAIYRPQAGFCARNNFENRVASGHAEGFPPRLRMFVPASDWTPRVSQRRFPGFAASIPTSQATATVHEQNRECRAPCSMAANDGTSCAKPLSLPLLLAAPSVLAISASGFRE